MTSQYISIREDLRESTKSCSSRHDLRISVQVYELKTPAPYVSVPPPANDTTVELQEHENDVLQEIQSWNLYVSNAGSE